MKKHVFLSYCHEDKGLVSKLRDDLVKAGEVVWWDDEINPGENWKYKVDLALSDAYSIVICFSSNSEQRHESGIFPELRRAVEAFQRYKPGSIFLIPIKLSSCSIPFFPIDSTTNLKDIQYIDLFPKSNWKQMIQKLLQSVKKAPLHP